MIDKDKIEQARKQLHANFEVAQNQFKEGLEGLELIKKALEQQQPKQLPKPTHYTITDGGKWVEWRNYGQPFRGAVNALQVHAIKFDDGSIFDMVNGWRAQSIEGSVTKETPRIYYCRYCEKQSTVSEELIMHDKGCPYNKEAYEQGERLVPRYPDTDDKNWPNLKPSTDQRIVLRTLLEVVEKTLENFIYKDRRNPNYDPTLVLKEVKAALATEKSELKAP